MLFYIFVDMDFTFSHKHSIEKSYVMGIDAVFFMEISIVRSPKENNFFQMFSVICAVAIFMAQISGLIFIKSFIKWTYFGHILTHLNMFL